MGAHPDRPVWGDERDGRAVIVKRYRPGAGRQVFDDMQALWASPFGASRHPPAMPEPLTFDEATGELTMHRVETVDLPVTLDESAAVVADLHRSGVSPRRLRGARRLVRSLWRKAVDLAGSPVGADAARLAERLTAEAPVDRTVTATHGDISPVNVLATSVGPCLVDFDRMALASPVRDVAHWGAWSWARSAASGQRPSWDVGDAFVDAYLGLAPELTDEVVGALGFHRAAALLRIAHGWSQMRADPELAAATLNEATTVLA